MRKDKAYIETTILADVLLKTGDDSEAAKEALSRFDTTQLPVYAIKEFKAGPLRNVSYLHAKLLDAKSYPATLAALAKNIRHRYQVATCLRLLADLHSRIINEPHRGALVVKYGSLAEADQIIFDSLVSETKLLVAKAWLRCQGLAHATVDPLTCYQITPPKVRNNGRYDLSPTTCKKEDCCMAPNLSTRKIQLTKLASTIKKLPAKPENTYRQKVLHDLAVRSNMKLKDKECKRLGDAVFALYCPPDAHILTTNIDDHRPLAEAIGKTAISPTEVLSTPTGS